MSQSSYSSITNKTSILEEENQKLREENQKLREEIDLEKQKYIILDEYTLSEMNTLNQKNNELEFILNKQENELNYFTEEINELNSEISSEKESSNRYKSENLELKEMNRKLVDEVKALNSLIENLSSNLSAISEDFNIMKQNYDYSIKENKIEIDNYKMKIENKRKQTELVEQHNIIAYSFAKNRECKMIIGDVLINKRPESKILKKFINQLNFSKNSRIVVTSYYNVNLYEPQNLSTHYNISTDSYIRYRQMIFGIDKSIHFFCKKSQLNTFIYNDINIKTNRKCNIYSDRIISVNFNSDLTFTLRHNENSFNNSLDNDIKSIFSNPMCKSCFDLSILSIPPQIIEKVNSEEISSPDSSYIRENIYKILQNKLSEKLNQLKENNFLFSTIEIESSELQELLRSVNELEEKNQKAQKKINYIKTKAREIISENKMLRKTISCLQQEIGAMDEKLTQEISKSILLMEKVKLIGQDKNSINSKLISVLNTNHNLELEILKLKQCK